MQSGIWQVTDLFVLCWRILKTSETISFLVLFLSEKRHHTISKQLSDITSSHHLISPEEWSLPFRNGWTSNLAASDLSQYHYWGKGPWWQWGGFFPHILLWNTWENQVDDYVTNHKWKLNYLIFKGRFGLESKILPDFVLTTTVMWCGVYQSPHVFYSIFHEETVKKGCEDHCSQENSTTATATQLPCARNCTWIPWIFWVSWGIAPSNLQTSSIGALIFGCVWFKKKGTTNKHRKQTFMMSVTPL